MIEYFRFTIKTILRFLGRVLQPNLSVFKDEHKGSEVSWLGQITQTGNYGTGDELTCRHTFYFGLLSMLAHKPYRSTLYKRRIEITMDDSKE